MTIKALKRRRLLRSKSKRDRGAISSVCRAGVPCTDALASFQRPGVRLRPGPFASRLPSLSPPVCWHLCDISLWPIKPYKGQKKYFRETIHRENEKVKYIQNESRKINVIVSCIIKMLSVMYGSNSQSNRGPGSWRTPQCQPWRHKGWRLGWNPLSLRALSSSASTRSPDGQAYFCIPTRKEPNEGGVIHRRQELDQLMVHREESRGEPVLKVQH